MVSIHMPQIPPRLNHIPDPSLELLCLWKPAIHLAIPQHRLLFTGLAAARILGGGGGVLDGDDECAARRRLQGDFAETCGKGRQQFLRVLFTNC